MEGLTTLLVVALTAKKLCIISIWRGGAVDNVQMEVRRLLVATHKRKPTRARPDSDDPVLSCLLLGWLKALAANRSLRRLSWDVLGCGGLSSAEHWSHSRDEG